MTSADRDNAWKEIQNNNASITLVIHIPEECKNFPSKVLWRQQCMRNQPILNHSNYYSWPREFYSSKLLCFMLCFLKYENSSSVSPDIPDVDSSHSSISTQSVCGAYRIVSTALAFWLDKPKGRQWAVSEWDTSMTRPVFFWLLNLEHCRQKSWSYHWDMY